MQKNPTCPHCRNTSYKNGTTASSKQRFRCSQCKKSFIADYSYTACTTSNHQIKILLTEGCGIKSISRILSISPTTVLKRIKALAQTITMPTISINKEYELDEICTYVKNKSRLRWIVYAIRKDTKEVVDFTVGNRTNKTLKKVTETLILSEAKQVFTDKLQNYIGLLPKEIHSTKRNGTNHIERKNLTLRTHLKRLSRRTICYSKSLVMLIACLKIYFWG